MQARKQENAAVLTHSDILGYQPYHYHKTSKINDLIINKLISFYGESAFLLETEINIIYRPKKTENIKTKIR